MRTVYVVTHPEAEHHVKGLVGGWYDSQLTPAGERHAQRIAHELRCRVPPGRPVAIFSSDLARTWSTAEAIGRTLGADPRAEPRLREMSYGQAEGRPQAWLDQRFVPPPAVGDRLGHAVGVPGAETKSAFAGRIYAAMADLLASDLTDLIVVTHGFAATFAIASWIGMPVDSVGYVNFYVGSGSITTLREDDFFCNRQVVRLGATDHLR